MAIAMSGMLRLGGNIDNIKKAFEGMGSCNSFVLKRAKGGKVSKGGSCGTAILYEVEKFIAEMTKENNNTQIESKPIIKQEEVKVALNEEEIEFLREKGEKAFIDKYNKCPECGEEIQHTGGCLSCVSCGYSKC